MVSQKLYFLCPYGIGDTFIVCSYKKFIEAKYNTEIVFIIKKSHEVVLRLFGIKEYIIYNFSGQEIEAISQKTNQGDIKKGEIFLTRPGYEDENSVFRHFIERKISFVEMYTKSLGIQCIKIPNSVLPMEYPKVTKQLIEKLPGEIENITLVLPEMNAPAIDTVSLQYFENVIQHINGPVVVNMLRPNEKLSKYCIDLSLEELVALAINCKKVISARSGFCDLIYAKVKELEVIYPNYFFYDLYKLEDIFEEKNSHITETVFSYSEKIKQLNCKSVAIYGMGFIGKRIVKCLEIEKFKVNYVIDRRKDIEGVELPIYQLEDDLPDVDLIIVTPEQDKNELIKALNVCKGNAEVVFYKDLIK